MKRPKAKTKTIRLTLDVTPAMNATIEKIARRIGGTKVRAISAACGALGTVVEHGGEWVLGVEADGTVTISRLNGRAPTSEPT